MAFFILGSGKTTLLRHILSSHEHKHKVAVIVNDMADLNIDAAMVGGDSGAIVQAKKEVVSLSNGCICCTLRGDLIREIDRIRKLGKHDYILVESTGIAEPQQVAESFCADPETAALAEDPSQMLWKVARLDTCVTVVDAREFPRLMNSVKRFKDQFSDGMEEHDPDGEGEKSIADLLTEQVEFADVILVNKIDLVSEEEREKVLKVVSTLNPKAKVMSTEYGVVDLQHILNSKSFSMEEAFESPGWLVSMKSEVKSESEEFGITSFVYQNRKPFHPARLAAWVRRILHFSEDWNNKFVANDAQKLSTMESEFGQILRSKGFCWIAGRDEIQASWAHSGRLLMISPVTPWCATKPESEWGTETPEELEEMRKNFEGKFGDRRQAIVFIGINLKQDAISSSLDKCLLTDEEMENHSVTASYQYYDNLPAWVHALQAPGKSFVPILKQGQPHKFELLGEGLLLQLTNLALYCPPVVENHAAYESIVARVWLDIGEGYEKKSRLLATLRPLTAEQCCVSIEVAEVGLPHWLRVELKTRNSKRSHSGEVSNSMDISQIEVHGTGLVHMTGFAEEEEDEHDHDHGEDEEDVDEEMADEQ